MDWYQPVWLNKSFLTKVLQGGDASEEITITDFTVTPVAAVGDGLTLNIFRVSVEHEVEGEQETTSFIVKVPPFRGTLQYDAESAGFFCKEHIIYTQLLTAMSDKVGCKFGPALFYSPINTCLVLEDLRDDGYVMCDEYQQLDLEHCRRVVETVAKFHASSVACYNESPKFIEGVGEDILWADSCVLKPWVKSAAKTMLRIVNVMDDCEQFADLLSDRVDQLWESVVKISKPKSTGLNVLNHGDLWSNNVLFRYNKAGQVEDVKFIDFQITKFASLALDLVNFIWTSANEEVRESGQSELYHAYLLVFNSTLEQVGCVERLTMEELREDVQVATDWGILMICCALPVIMASPEDALNLGGFRSQDFATNKFKKIYRGKHFRHLLPTVIKQFTEFFIMGRSF